MVEINFNILIVQAVSFLIAVVILWKIAWKPLVTFLQNRRKGIEENINAAKTSKENALKLEEDYKKKISLIEQEARVMFNNALEEGKKTRIYCLKRLRKRPRN
jgi:F-type H+-transporting ATPase subunit b